MKEDTVFKKIKDKLDSDYNYCYNDKQRCDALKNALDKFLEEWDYVISTMNEHTND